MPTKKCGWNYGIFKSHHWGVPTVVQWVKNPPAAAQATAEAQIESLAQELPYAVGVAIKLKQKQQWVRSSLVVVKDPMLSLLCLGSLL